MKTFKKIVSVVFASVFVLTAILALVLFNMDRRAFTAETYQKVFANEGFYNRIPTVMAKAIVASPGQGGLPLVIQGLTTQGWEAFLRTILPADTIKAIGDDALTSIFAYLNDETDSAQVSITPIKTRLTSDSAVQAVFTLLSTQPDCTLIQIAQITIAALGKGEIQFCNPPAQLQPVLSPIIQSELQITAAALPENVTLASADSTSPQTDPRTRLKVIRLIMRFSPLVPLVFLLATTVLMVNSFKSWLDWWGTPLLFSGMIAGFLSLSGAPVVGFFLQQILVKYMPHYLPAILLDYTNELAKAMIQQLLKPVFWQGLILAIIGFIMIGISFIIRLFEKTSKV